LCFLAQEGQRGAPIKMKSGIEDHTTGAILRAEFLLFDEGVWVGESSKF